MKIQCPRPSKPMFPNPCRREANFLPAPLLCTLHHHSPAKTITSWPAATECIGPHSTVEIERCRQPWSGKMTGRGRSCCKAASPSIFERRRPPKPTRGAAPPSQPHPSATTARSALRIQPCGRPQTTIEDPRPLNHRRQRQILSRLSAVVKSRLLVILVPRTRLPARYWKRRKQQQRP